MRARFTPRPRRGGLLQLPLPPRNGVLSPLAGLISGAGEKLGVLYADRKGVPETGTWNGIETFL